MLQPPAERRRIRRHIDNLGHEDDLTSYRAMAYLIRYYGARALEALVEASYSPNVRVRYRVAWALGHTLDPRAFEPLVRLVEDPDPAVRYDSTLGLGILGDPRVIEVLLDLARRCHHDWPAFNGFDRLGLQAAPVMEQLLQEPDAHLRHGAMAVLARLALDHRNGHCAELVRGCLTDPDANVRADAQYWVEELETGRRE
jgi:HEAT repeat protein